ncbi:PREDICTED: uncharacterized protein LOC109486186 isoform X4 [Branchiostoma belcheri]|uniref:Uncharacterized protein LOC109486186 isoform X4 n=1 Tax=Branchiostoma belcheri TaxID=7741 RepID=A0A6P5ATX0_BRABE|nr:PREDICTED: uncharacterized protein LOC109486186 isoform X4 [Branchiostoma belcheri]
MATGVQNKIAARQLLGLRMPMTTVMLFTGLLLILLQPTASQPEPSLLAMLTDTKGGSSKIDDTAREALVDGGHVRVARSRPLGLAGRPVCVSCPCVRYCWWWNRHVCCKRKCIILVC